MNNLSESINNYASFYKTSTIVNEHNSDCDRCYKLLEGQAENGGRVIICFGIRGKIISRKINLHDCFCILPPEAVCNICFKEYSSFGPVLRASFHTSLRLIIFGHYCSITCGAKHDKKMGDVPTIVMKHRCMNCCTYRHKMKKCGKCRLVHYCSVKCQKINRLDHNRICGVKHLKITENYPTIGTENVCMSCNTHGQKVKSCGKCRRAYYCSVKCQRVDWKEHKKICGNEFSI